MSYSGRFVNVKSNGSNLSSKDLTIVLSWFSKSLSARPFLVLLITGITLGIKVSITFLVQQMKCVSRNYTTTILKVFFHYQCRCTNI